MSGFIEVNGLTKRFSDHVIIEDLSFSVDKGEVAVLQGPSGIGKSTLLRCLTYLEPYQSGRVRIDRLETVPGMSERTHADLIRTLRQQLGFVFQNFNLFPHLTVLQNVTLGATKVLRISVHEAEDQAMRLLKRVGLAHKAQAFPRQLSGGQQQRVGIARALALHPKAVLFDEPTSSLDPAMKEEIIRVMEDFATDGLTMLVVTHEPKVLERIATRVVTLGPHCAILSDDRLRPPHVMRVH